MDNQQYDLIVIGAGPGGYVSAIRAAQVGMKVCVVEANHVGGICLNWGCIPTKALLRSADIYRNIMHAQTYGLSVKSASYDLKAIVKRSRDVAGQLNGGVRHLLKKNKVTLIEGYARLMGGAAGARKVQVTLDKDKTENLIGKSVILATGARARQVPGLESDEKLIWSYKGALQPDCVPMNLVVVGSGAIGIEFASFFNALGANVTIVEMVDRILPAEDSEISALAQKSFEKQGMKFLCGRKIAQATKAKNSVELVLDDGTKLSADRVISAAGIVGNVEDIGLESLGIKTDRTHVVVNEWAETTAPGVYAIGDLAGPPWLAHKAEHEGVIAVERIAGLKGVHPLDAKAIAGCTYCHPQIASVGMREDDAKAAKREVKIGRFPFIANGKAIALGETEGMIKTIFDAKTGELLGAHMIGAEVTELIQGFSIARALETTEEDLMHTVFPHPTLSEMMHESVLAAYGRAIHI